MGCNYVKKVTEVTTERCNEMIDELEISLSNLRNRNCKCTKEERELLTIEIKKYPNHVWSASESGLYHFDLQNKIQEKIANQK